MKSPNSIILIVAGLLLASLGAEGQADCRLDPAVARGRFP